MDTVTKQAVSDYVVGEFVRANLRAPNEEERTELIRRYIQQHPELHLVGFAADVEYPVVRQNASAAAENTRRALVQADLSRSRAKLNQLEERMNDRYRTHLSAFTRIGLELDALLDIADGFHADAVAVVAEQFDGATPLVSSDLDVTKQANLLLASDDEVSLTSARFSAKVSPVAGGYIGSFKAGRYIDLYENNGKFWQLIGMTSTKSSATIMKAQWLFEDDTMATHLVFAALAAVDNWWHLEYTTDGTTWETLGTRQPLSEENIASIGFMVRGFRIVIHKPSADRQLQTGSWGHFYGLDRVRLSSSLYEGSGSMVLGPYAVQDAFDQPYAYSTVGVDVCWDLPDETDISLSVSKDGTTFIALDSDDLSAVLDNQNNTEALLNSDLTNEAVIDGADYLSALQFQNEALLNVYALGVLVRPELVTLNRNIRFQDGLSIGPAVRGWSLVDGRYYTTVELTHEQSIDFGDASITINGVERSGVVLVQPGIHRFGVDSANWTAINLTNISSLNELKAVDPLYPYNHRYLLEGAEYNSSFAGEKVYLGVTRIYGERMQFLPMEQFVRIESDDPDRFRYFSVVYQQGNTYFIVKADKNWSTWDNERFDVDWSAPATTSNLYIKVDMYTSDTAVTPVLRSITARCL